MPRGLRPAEDSRHRLLRARHAGAAQGQKDLLRHEDPGQTEGKLWIEAVTTLTSSHKK